MSDNKEFEDQLAHHLIVNNDGTVQFQKEDGTIVEIHDDFEEQTEEQRAARAVTPGSRNKKALLIGINYLSNPKARLRGCINDVENVHKFLCEQNGFPIQNVHVLRDDLAPSMPTRVCCLSIGSLSLMLQDRILQELDWLVEGAAPGDSLVFHYRRLAFRGSRKMDGTRCVDVAEEWWLNAQTICPCDYDTAGQIIDNELYDRLCKPLPAGAQLVAVFDSCHSGTILDVPFVFVDREKYSDAHKSSEGGFFSRHMHGWRGALTGATGLAAVLASHVMREVGHQGAKYGRRGIMKMLNTTEADVYCISGCRDEQTSADAKIDGESAGAMSYALLTAMREHPAGSLSWSALLRAMRDILQRPSKTFTQMPQLTMGRESDTELPFLL